MTHDYNKGKRDGLLQAQTSLLLSAALFCFMLGWHLKEYFS